MNVTLVNHAVPLAWPSRGNVDDYPWDYDASQRFTRLETGHDPYPQAHYNTSAPDGWLDGVSPFLGLIEQVAYTRAYLRQSVRPGPWTMDGVGVERSGGIPWASALSPFAALGEKSG